MIREEEKCTLLNMRVPETVLGIKIGTQYAGDLILFRVSGVHPSTACSDCSAGEREIIVITFPLDFLQCGPPWTGHFRLGMRNAVPAAHYTNKINEPFFQFILEC